MEQDFTSNSQNLPRLINLLESLLIATQHAKIGIEAHLHEAKNLLHGWELPCNEVISTTPSCQCAENQKHQLMAFLEKVDKAVKYSQSVREGRTDVKSPWMDDAANNTQKGDMKKSTSRETPPQRIGFGHFRERFLKGRLSNGTLKKASCKNSGSENEVHGKVESEHSVHCPLHSSSLPEISQKSKNINTVGLAEALDVKGIPPELVTVLKSVHQYINRLRTTTLKNRAESSFLRHLNSVNERRWENFPSNGLINGLKAVTPKGCHRGNPMFQEDQITSQTSSLVENGLPYFGIWNNAVCSLFSVHALCVQYQNEDIWTLLQSRMQQLQLSQAEWQVCNILSHNPLLTNPELDFKAAPLYLKAATALCHLTSLNLPVLVKTYRS
ncbi:Cell death protein 3 [Frankliniella fusca]|uniref:Cell death protein 3 n=1 Tax=Frankliniella fusca TaxID=407009 RepID=A0AAE1LC25_9NEOP|nr:Cell death protein 3 [Frankliniella fusca]